MESGLKVAQELLKIDAVKIKPENPFTWASGWKSPIYCDNRKILSFPASRKVIYQEFAKKVKDLYPEAEIIAGVATGAIAHGMLVAEELGLPFIYIRSAAKGHGLENMVEGNLEAGQKVVIIEDLVSTGGSSLKAADAIKAKGAEILGMLAIFTYKFPQAEKAFCDANIKLDTLSDYEILLDYALKNGDITEAQKNKLDPWRKDPENWGR